MTPTASSRVVHLELHTGEPTRACAFYAEVCDWPTQRIDTRTGSYLALELAETIGGGIVQCPIERPLWLPYIEVDEIWRATDRARLAGASVLLEPREGPAGWRSVIATRAAGQVAFWQPKPWAARARRRRP